jgi:ribonuclease BN (tRNA processing enzyme)
MADPKPTQLRLRTYQVGFGDCFLLSFRYPPKNGRSQDRHVLIDFGSTGQPEAAGAKLMLRVANNIKEACGGKLHAVVATHRHKDHISGFATNAAGTGPGDIIASLKPDLVVQPWTEDPKAQPDATRPTQALTGKQTLTAALADMHAFSAAALAEAQHRRAAFGPVLTRQLAFLGEDNLANLSAVKNLMEMGKNIYVYYGRKSRLEKVLPGVTVTVLGPPTLEQTDTIRQQRAKDEAEFWHFQAAAGKSFTAASRSPFAAKYRYGQRPAHVRWIIPRMDGLRGDQLLEIVRQLDKQMNNTSVILLFEAGDKKLLFPGDAQIENWAYALEQADKKPALKKKLEDVNLYKVGHHGSLNATPKTLWAWFKHKKSAHGDDLLKTVVSTMAGKHGKPERGTEVPRRKLVEELQKQSDFFTTQSLKGKTLSHDVVLDL